MPGESMFSERLRTIIDHSRIREQEPMRAHTTFRIGGPADYFVDVKDTEELMALLSLCREEGIPWYILGNGSNLLVADRGVKGVVIRLSGEFEKYEIDKGETEGVLYAGAGIRLAKLARTAADAGLSGLAFAGGIPGTLGGALVMNAGAYGGEMKDCVRSVTVADPAGCIRELDAREMQFGYRTSILQRRDYIALRARLVRPFGDPEELLVQIEELNRRRLEKQPLEYPSAGSTFKRPEGNFAGKLIMESGLRGYRMGGAAVSEKHCGFVINTEEATAEDVYRLIEKVKEIVHEKTGVMLEPEVKYWGEF